MKNKNKNVVADPWSAKCSGRITIRPKSHGNATATGRKMKIWGKGGDASGSEGAGHMALLRRKFGGSKPTGLKLNL